MALTDVLSSVLLMGPKSLHVHTEKNYKHFLLTLNLIQLNY
ncbi:hypothetical protein LTSEURB_6276, partial [Salmonella enterica subsp. enterica serovar Urbana str. R8-2977]